MSQETTKQVIEKYFASDHGSVSMLADDVVFSNMATGEDTVGPQAVLGMLDYFYRMAFTAEFELTNAIYADNQAVMEGMFVGKHSGEFAGIPATGKDVRVPLCIIYEVDGEKINKARIYFELPALMAQLGVSP